MKVESPAAPTDAAKGFMAYTNFVAPPNRSYVFCGWVYVPASNPNSFQAQWLYISASPSITVKDQWVPFCTPVVNVGTGAQALWPAVVSNNGSVAGRHFFVDDLAVIETTHRQMPFDADSADHRKMEFKNLYTEAFPSVVRKSVANVSARVNPFIVLDDCNSTTGWQMLAGQGITFDLYNGGVRSNMPVANPEVYVKYTLPTAQVRRKRYLVVNTENIPGGAEILYEVTTAQGGLFRNPVVQHTEVAGAGIRRFYDIPKNAGDISSLTFYVEGNPNSQWAYTVYDIGESDRITAQANMATSTGWVLDASSGLWKRTTTEQQRSTFDDAEAQTGQFVSSMTYLGFEQMGLTYNQWENM
jgi:hypothetical protein